MAFRSANSSSGSSPSSTNASVDVSPASTNIPLSNEPLSRSSSTRGTPNRNSVDLPRTQTASKGGCWTCRLRRKKCDEQREGDSCRTCIRLTIECLGWGPKRPEWMRDKQQVEQYKANIKAQLTRKGLIRGQPRASLLQAQGNTNLSQQNSSSRPPAYHRFSAPADSSSNNSISNSLRPDHDFGLGFGFVDSRQNSLPGVAGASNSSFLHLPGASYSDSNLVDLGTSFFQYSPQSTTPLSTLGSEPSLDLDFTQIGVAQSHGGFDFDLRVPSPIQNFPVLSGQTAMQEDYVMYYFENVRKLHFLFGGNDVANITYTLILEEPRGALTNAVCALASLHFSRQRVAQGLEAPNTNPEHSMGKSFHDEAFFQLANAKQLRGEHNEADVLAALHLVCFSQMSGGMTDWQLSLRIALDWLGQIGLASDDNATQTLGTMSTTAQLVVKCTMWMDIFSSITFMRAPRFLPLYKRLLGGDKLGQQFWSDLSGGMNMQSLTGCPDEVMLAIAEVSALAHWKVTEQRRGSLSARELIRRGDEIEKRVRQQYCEATSFLNQAPLHPGLLQTTGLGDSGSPFISEEMYRLLSSVFRESVLLYLHTILNDPNPAVSEITSSVETIVQLLNQLPPSEVDRALIFPICIAGCMTDDSSRRDYLKSRLQSQDETMGNLMRTRLLMEAVWHKRDVSGRSSDWRETMGERGLNLLLV